MGEILHNYVYITCRQDIKVIYGVDSKIEVCT